ncbi:MAG: DUF2764 family protein [Lentisphaeria bacterium]|nr:DUF2764 family protein [Lentisphaeria bacterium]
MMYPFLSAILPVLEPGTIPEMTLAEFDALLAGELSGRLFDRLTAWDDPERRMGVPLYARMQQFIDCMEYRIASIRAERLKFSSSFEEPGEFYGEIDHALNHMLSSGALEREKLLDLLLWRKLDELEIGHELDFEHLCIYRIRLSLLQKYAQRDESAGRNNFESALEKLAAGFNEP